MIASITLEKPIGMPLSEFDLLPVSSLKRITWTVWPAVMKSQIGLQNPRNIFNASIESQRAMAQWRCSSPTLQGFCYGGYDGIYDFLHSGAYVVMRKALFMVMIVFISCSQSSLLSEWCLLMSWNIFVALFVTTSGKSNQSFHYWRSWIPQVWSSWDSSAWRCRAQPILRTRPQQWGFPGKHLDEDGWEEINNGKRTGPTGSLVPL